MLDASETPVHYVLCVILLSVGFTQPFLSASVLCSLLYYFRGIVMCLLICVSGIYLGSCTCVFISQSLALYQHSCSLQAANMGVNVIVSSEE